MLLLGEVGVIRVGRDHFEAVVLSVVKVVIRVVTLVIFTIKTLLLEIK